MSLLRLLSRKLQTAKYLTSDAIALRYTPWEFLLLYVSYAIANFTGRDRKLSEAVYEERLRREARRDGCWAFRDAKLPRMNAAYEKMLFTGIFRDTLLVYTKYDDCYDESLIDDLFVKLPEGPYGLRNGTVDVRVAQGDVVIDAGSWAGDFAAYASAKGASAIYAFEPTDETFEYLLKTAALNPNIHPVKAGLGEAKASASFFVTHEMNSVSNTLMPGRVAGEERTVSITTIDDFVRENALPRVDFIKADIEGAERQMLMGAAETLRRFAPKLAICTYHLPDDPEVLERIIKEANPEYRVVQKAKKLFASVGA
ncbi:MAG: FkbM family methyltransferase [Synergistaceae bacterium]|jgi:FkbM family methyltransferase|nr:FkbM family methyltransferase [Synergistaceae bacterium]